MRRRGGGPGSGMQSQLQPTRRLDPDGESGRAGLDGKRATLDGKRATLDGKRATPPAVTGGFGADGRQVLLSSWSGAKSPAS
jgi:hypothetical protein